MLTRALGCRGSTRDNSARCCGSKHLGTCDQKACAIVCCMLRRICGQAKAPLCPTSALNLPAIRNIVVVLGERAAPPSVEAFHAKPKEPHKLRVELLGGHHGASTECSCADFHPNGLATRCCSQDERKSHIVGALSQPHMFGGCSGASALFDHT